MEQLTEMTRLIFKLSEVENILLKANIGQSVFKQDPKNALVQFIKVLYNYPVVVSLDNFSEKGLCIRFGVLKNKVLSKVS